MLASNSPLFSTMDQVMSSASNALLLFSVALVAPVATFGNVTLLMSILWIFQSFNRGALGNPLLLVSNLPVAKIRVESAFGFGWALISGLLAGASIIGVAAIVGDLLIGIPLAAAIPVVLAQDILRFGAIAQGHSRLAAQSDAFWCLCMAATFIVNTFRPVIPPVVVVCVWACSGFVALLVLAIGSDVRPRWKHITDWWRTYAGARIRFGSAASLSMVSVAIVTAMMTGILGSAPAGSFRGAASLFGPVAMIISAVPLVFIPSARVESRSARRQWKLLVWTALITSVLTVAFTAGMTWLPDSVGAMVLGGTWLSASSLIPFVGLESAAMCWMWAAYTLFQTLGRTRTLMFVRISQTTLQLGGVATVAMVTHSIVWVAITLAATTCSMVVMSLVVATTLAARSDVAREVNKTDVADDRDPALEDRLELRETPWPEIDVLAEEMARKPRSSVAAYR